MQAWWAAKGYERPLAEDLIRRRLLEHYPQAVILSEEDDEATRAPMYEPGFSGFVAELQVLIGAWQAFSSFAVIAGVGILVGVVYTLRVTVKASPTPRADSATRSAS